MRRYSKDEATNSCHVILADSPPLIFDDAKVEAKWGWCGPSPALQVSPGDRRLTIVRREGGYRIDKIVLTSDPKFSPADAVLRESPRASAE
jgi:hypothetical protein